MTYINRLLRRQWENGVPVSGLLLSISSVFVLSIFTVAIWWVGW